MLKCHIHRIALLMTIHHNNYPKHRTLKAGPRTSCHVTKKSLDVIPSHVVASRDMKTTLGDLGHYAGPATLILSSLAGGPKHGYALTQDIEDFSGVRLQPGTLYGAIKRLEQQGLIEPLVEEGRRRPYRLTAHGASVLQDHLKAQQQVSEVGLQRLSTAWSVA